MQRVADVGQSNAEVAECSETVGHQAFAAGLIDGWGGAIKNRHFASGFCESKSRRESGRAAADNADFTIHANSLNIRRAQSQMQCLGPEFSRCMRQRHHFAHGFGAPVQLFAC